MDNKPKIAVIDNYDSFTYNLVHLVKQLRGVVDVYRNDSFDLDTLEKYDKILLSPGPGIPEEAGLLMKVIERYSATKPILGVCLGHQALGEFFGGKLKNIGRVMHGVATPAKIVKEDYIFEGLSEEITVGRYHSWIVDIDGFPDCLDVLSVSDEGQIMALRHRDLDIRGIQFHPESVLTPEGETIINNWLKH